MPTGNWESIRAMNGCMKTPKTICWPLRRQKSLSAWIPGFLTSKIKVVYTLNLSSLKIVLANAPDNHASFA